MVPSPSPPPALVNAMSDPARVAVTTAALLTVLLLGACTSGPRFLQDEQVNTALIATDAAQQAAIGERVVWGGRIIDNRSLEDGSLLEVLAYPLDRNEAPRTERSAQGRFLVLHDGFLEPEDYHRDRLVTARGTITEITEGQVGEADYTFPLVEADGLHLWPAETARAGDGSRVRIGVGIHISR